MKKSIKVLLSLVGATIIIGASFFILQNKLLDNTEQKEQENQSEKTTINRLGQSFDTKTGKYIIEKDYSVYYIPKEDFYGIKIEIPEDIGKYGKYNTKDVYTQGPITDEDDGSFNGYKLNLTNIKCGYNISIGNNESSDYIIFLGKDGSISELKFSVTQENKLEINISKNVADYKEIVNVVQTADMDGNYAKLIDKVGNQFAYYGAENTKERITEQAGQYLRVLTPFEEGLSAEIKVTSNGDVYVSAKENSGDEIDLSSCAKKEITGEYKLSLSNITSVYSFVFGNYSGNLHILLLDKFGNLSELAIEYTQDGMSVELNEKVKSNIETVLYKLYPGGHGAIIIEKNGNEQYF